MFNRYLCVCMGMYMSETDKRKRQQERETENWHLKHMTAGEESQKIWGEGQQ